MEMCVRDSSGNHQKTAISNAQAKQFSQGGFLMIAAYSPTQNRLAITTLLPTGTKSRFLGHAQGKILTSQNTAKKN